MKRLLLMLMAALLVGGSVGFSPVRQAAAASTLADFFPEKTFAYGEMDTRDLPKTLNTLLEVGTKFGLTVPENWRTLAAKAYEDQFKRPIDVDKDLIGWIGDKVAFGVTVPDNAVETVFNPRMTQGKTEYSFVFTVRDEVVLDAFLKDYLTAPFYAGKTATTETINGETVSTYEGGTNGDISRWKGYVAFGNNRLILDTIKDKKPALSGNALYKKLAATLKPGTLASTFIRTPFSTTSGGVVLVALSLAGPAIGNVFNNIVSSLSGTPTAIPSPTPFPNPNEKPLVDALFNLGGSIYSVRAEGKALILDNTSAFDAENLAKLDDLLKIPVSKVFTQAPKSVSGKLLGAIPADAAAVIVGSDIPQLYNSQLTLAAAAAKGAEIFSRTSNPTDPLKTFSNQIEGGAKLVLGLDLKTDVLAWMGGDYAAYVTLDKDGMVNQLSNKALPAASTILIESTDAAKSKTVADTLAGLIGKQMKTDLGTPGADGLYKVTAMPGASASFGSSGDTFVFTTASSYTAKPAASLSTSTAWQNAAKLLPKAYSQMFYVDAAQLKTLVNAAQVPPSPSSAAQLKQLGVLLDTLESALIVYGDLGAGVSTTSFVLILK